jgi:hypothetical protein
LKDLDDAEVDINRAWETIREIMKISARERERERLGYYELKKHKPWLDEGFTKLLDKKETSQTGVVT